MTPEIQNSGPTGILMLHGFLAHVNVDTALSFQLPTKGWNFRTDSFRSRMAGPRYPESLYFALLEVFSALDRPPPGHDSPLLV